jgi:SDR family mycofactocin-dependent oxidoreductase
MRRLDNKIVFITGAARGQGRAHAVRVAEEGGHVIGVDICADIASNAYGLAVPEDLEETARLVEKNGGRMVSRVVDVRDRVALAAALEEGVAELGGLHGVVAQAGICPLGATEPAAFVDAISVDFVGVFNAIDVALPHLSRGGSIVATGSTAALIPGKLDNAAKGPGGLGYAWAKRTVATLVHDLAVVMAPEGIRVNAIHPVNVNTDMLHSDIMYRTFRPDLEAPTREDAMESFPALTATGDPWVEPEDVAATAAFLLSEDARFVTGMQMRVDAGSYVKLRPQPPTF